MSLLTASQLSKSFGADDIFTGISLGIPERARIGLVGPNGVGKTTLLRILAGLDAPDGGTVHRARSADCAYLPQEADLSARHSLWEESLSAFEDLLAVEAELAELEAAMARPDGREAALARYGPLQEDFDRRGGYTYRAQIEATLSGLGFQRQDFHRPLPQLSGGERTRALLARLLLMGPDLLILDEPTNHLDIAAVEWLENTLRDWRGAVVIVSHDRYFLDRVVNVIWEMSPMGFETYRGNYSAYLQQRADRHQQRQRLFEAEIARLENELEYVRRNIAGQRTAQAKGKLRRLSRHIEAIERGGLLAVQGKNWSQVSAELEIGGRPMGVDEAWGRLKGLRAPVSRLRDLKLQLRSSGRSGDLVLRTRGLAVGYPDAEAPLFTVPDLTLRRGECAAVIGPNGAGKTTFLKTLLGELAPLGGELILGASLDVGYFAQAHEALVPERTLMEEILDAAPHLAISEARSFLARFLFTEDEVFKEVAVLSGGERGRLALARLALTDANLLLLDEPSNHLDIPAQEVLQAVLAAYEGTILLVSHDRYLIDALGTQIWEIQPRQGSLVVFEGRYSEYRSQAEKEAQALEEPRTRAAEEQNGREAVEKPRLTAYQRRRRQGKLEEQIHDLEAHLQALGSQLEDPPDDLAEVQRLGEAYDEAQRSLDELLSEWGQLGE